MLALSLYVSAQQDGQRETGKGNASLEAALGQLGRALKASVVFDSGMRYGRRTVSLKRAGARCDISFQAMKYPRSYVNESREQSSLPDFSYSEWKIKLSDLDPDKVAVENSAIGDQRVVRFATLAGKETIRLEGSTEQRVKTLSKGSIDVSTKMAAQVAAALEQAIIACRE